MMQGVGNWLLYWSGVGNEGGYGYGFWSGIGSCLTYLAILGAAWRHLNCHAAGCWRVGRHKVNGTPYTTCKKHHPEIDGRVTHQDIARAHAEAKAAATA